MKKSFRSSLLAGLLAAGLPLAASPVYTSITNFTTTGNAQAQLVSQLPYGSFTSSNSFATPFTIGTGNNYGVANSGSPITATVGISNVTNVFTIINAFAPQPGATLGAIHFNYADGTTTSINLVSGYNVRDFYQGVYENTVTAPNVKNAFTYANITGGAGSGNSSNGAYGTYVFDEQDFTLTDTSQLNSITITSPNNNTVTGGGFGSGSPILLALTVENSPAATTATPEPASILLFGAGITGMALVSRRFRRC